MVTGCRCLACDKPRWLNELASFVAGADSPLVLSVPCVGVSAPSQACQCLGFPIRGSEIADLEFASEPALRKIHAGEQVLLGPQAGDISRTVKHVCVCVCVCMCICMHMLLRRA